MLKKTKTIFTVLVFALVCAGTFFMMRPTPDPRKSFAVVSVLCHHYLQVGEAALSGGSRRFLPAVCVDVKRRYFVMSNQNFMLSEYGSIKIWFSDESSVPATLVFNDEDAGLAVVQAETVPSHMQALPMSKVSCGEKDVDGYHFLFSPSGHSVVKKSVSLPSKTLYDFGLWEAPGLAPDAIFVCAQDSTLAGLHVMTVGGKDFFVKGEHIAYVVALLQKNPQARMFKPHYVVQGVQTNNLEQTGFYTPEVDRALSVEGDHNPAHEVFVVLEGDGVFEEGDVMKYRHVDQQGSVAYWGGPNPRKDTSDRVKVLRRGEILELRSQTHPASVARYNYKNNAVFFQIGLFLRALSGWPKRHVWFYSLLRPAVIETGGISMFDTVNDKTVKTVEELEVILNSNDPVLFSAVECYTQTIGALALPGTACDVTSNPSSVQGGLT